MEALSLLAKNKIRIDYKTFSTNTWAAITLFRTHYKKLKKKRANSKGSGGYLFQGECGQSIDKWFSALFTILASHSKNNFHKSKTYFE